MFNRHAKPTNQNNSINEGEAERFAAIVIGSAAHNRLPSPTTSASPSLLVTAEIPINPERLTQLLHATKSTDHHDSEMGDVSEDDYLPKDTISLDPKVNSNMQPIGTKKPRIARSPAGMVMPPLVKRGADTNNDRSTTIPGLFGYYVEDPNVGGLTNEFTTASRSSSGLIPGSRNISGTSTQDSFQSSRYPANSSDSTCRTFSGQTQPSMSDRRISSSSSQHPSSATHPDHTSTSMPAPSSSHKRSATLYPPRPPSPRSAATKSQIAQAAGETRAALKRAEESFHMLTSLSGMRRSEDEREIEYLQKDLEYRRKELDRVRQLLRSRDADVVRLRGRAEKAEERVRELERQARELEMAPEVKIERTEYRGGW